MRLAIVAAALITGCAAYDPGNSAELTAAADDQLCASYHAKSAGLAFGAATYEKNRPAIRDEIIRRELVAPSEWGIIDEHKIRVGMTECAALASWGPPTRVNRASYGDQWVYCGYNCIRNQYVYVRGGRVTAWN